MEDVEGLLAHFMEVVPPLREVVPHFWENVEPFEELAHLLRYPSTYVCDVTLWLRDVAPLMMIWHLLIGHCTFWWDVSPFDDDMSPFDELSHLLGMICHLGMKCCTSCKQYFTFWVPYTSFWVGHPFYEVIYATHVTFNTHLWWTIDIWSCLLHIGGIIEGISDLSTLVSCIFYVYWPYLHVLWEINTSFYVFGASNGWEGCFISHINKRNTFHL